jgi:vacuolar-type H+-ATPase subunit F/Vma7
MGLVMITEPLAAEVEDTIVELGTTGAYEAVLKELIRRAVGIEIKI